VDRISISQVRRVQKYSAYARFICTTLLAFWLAGIGFVLYVIVFRPTTNQPASGLGVLAIQACLASGIVYLLHRTFDNMARGEIFSSRNVQHIRRIAFIVGGVGVVRLLVGIYVSTPLAGESLAPFRLNPGSLIPGALEHLGIAGIIFLASWIMQVGLGVTNEAAELRRDAELVV
jgi:hypothetical protein